MWHIKISAAILKPVSKFLNVFAPVADLLARCWIAYVFFIAGVAKITDWQTTLMLFAHEYQVPLIPTDIAAYLGTAFELILPLLLVLGLGGRITIFLFFMYNFLCVCSFHFLWTPEGTHGLYQHINWGLILLLLMVHGPGKISLDYVIEKKWGHLLLKMDYNQ